MGDGVTRAGLGAAPASDPAVAGAPGEGACTRPQGGRADTHVLQGRSAGRAPPPLRAAAPSQSAATAPIPLAELPDDLSRLIVHHLPVPHRRNLALASKESSGLVQQSLDRLRPLALQVRGMAGLPEGEPRLRAVLDAVFASAQPQLAAQEQAWLLRAAVVRTDLLEPPHRFVFHRLTCEQCGHLPDDNEKAALVAVLAGQIPSLPEWVIPREPPQPELGPVFHRLAATSAPGLPQSAFFDARLSPEAKTERAAALAARFEPKFYCAPGSIGARREAFEDCRRLALELPVSLRSAPLAALAAQIRQLSMGHYDPHSPTPQGRRMIEAGVDRLLADTAALVSQERLGVLKQLVIQIDAVPAVYPKTCERLRRQLQRHLADHPLERGHESTLDGLLEAGRSRAGESR